VSCVPWGPFYVDVVTNKNVSHRGFFAIAIFAVSFLLSSRPLRTTLIPWVLQGFGFTPTNTGGEVMLTTTPPAIDGVAGIPAPST